MPSNPDPPISIEPSTIHNGLAIYDTGKGRPTFLMPYPHGHPVTPTAEGGLAMALRELELRVISFDPPGAFRSTRPAQVSMKEFSLLQ